jgi:hypothetical protein
VPTEFDLNISFAEAMTKLSGGVWDWDQQLGGVPIDEIEVLGAQNEVVGFQIRVATRRDCLLLLDHTNWLHPLGFIPRIRLDIQFPSLRRSAVEVYAIGYIEGDDRRSWMETLDRTGYAEVPAHRPQGVYVRIRIPPDCEPGFHRGRVRAYIQTGFEDEILVWDGRVKLQVADIRLPDVKDWSFHLGLWQHCTSIARLHRVPLWSEAHFVLIDRYFASLAQLGQKAVTVIAAEIPWSGQRCFRDRAYPSALYEHAIIDVTRDENGELGFHFNKLDRLLELAAQHNMDQEIEVLGLLSIWTDEEFGFGKVSPDHHDAIRIRCYDQRSGAISYLKQIDELHAFVRALHDHFEALGLLDRVRISADEPSDMDALETNLTFLKSAAPGFKFKVAANHMVFMESPPPDVTDAVLILPLACRKPELTTQLREVLHSKGGRLLWYVCCWPPIPNTFLHSPLVEGQLHGWLTYLLKLDGFLRWNFCLWPGDPWARVSWRAPGWPAGDMYFVLPGKDGFPVETLRYEALRRAVQDYELLKLTALTLPPDRAETVIGEAFALIFRTSDIQDFAEVDTLKAEQLYSLDPDDYAAARRILFSAIETEKDRSGLGGL